LHRNIKHLRCTIQIPSVRIDDAICPLRISSFKHNIFAVRLKNCISARSMPAGRPTPMGSFMRIVFAAATMVAFCAPAKAASGYPTEVLAEYVYGCMKANGENRDNLRRCSCSIDVIASVLPYDRYVTAETFKEMGLVPGERGVIFRQSAPAKAAITDLKRAQAEADVRCF